MYFILGLAALSIILNLVKALLNVVAMTAKSTAEDFSNKGMKLMGTMTSSVKHKISLSNPSPVLQNKPIENKPDSADTKPDESMIDDPLLNLGLDKILEESNEEVEEEGIFNMAYEEEEDKQNQSPKKGEIQNGAVSPDKTGTSSTTLLIPPDGNEGGMPKVV